jgi:hypothetical protein
MNKTKRNPHSSYHSGSIVKRYKGGTIYIEGNFYYSTNCLDEFLGYQTTMLEAMQDLDEDEQERNSAEVIL